MANLWKCIVAVLLGITALAALAGPASASTSASPSNLHVVSTTDTSISLAWDATSASYTIYRDGQLLAPNVTVATFADTGLWPHSTHI